MKEHICGPDNKCCCYILGLVPSEECPVHGFIDERRCGQCGRFYKISNGAKGQEEFA